MPNTAETADSRVLYLRLLGYVRPYWRAFAFALLAMGLSAATEPLFPALMKSLLDAGFDGGSRGSLWWYPVGIIAIMMARGASGFVGDYAMHWTANKVIMDLRQAMFERMVRLPARFFDNQSSGALMSKIAYDVTGTTGAATSVITVLVKDSLAVAGLLGWMLYLNWKLSIVALIMIPLIALSVRAFSERLRRASRGGQAAMGEIMHVLQESIGAHKLVKVFGAQAYETRRFLEANRRQRRFNMKSAVAAALLGPLVQQITALVLAVIIGVALHQAASGDSTTVGSFASFITAMLMLLAPTKRLTDLNSPLQKGLAAAESVFELIDAPHEEDEGSVVLAQVRGDIVFERVSLRYPGSDKLALSGISLRVSAGEMVALVGPSGSGKTSLVNLLPRFYTSSAGRIVIDGHDITRLSLQSLRRAIALVSQDVVLSNDSVAANIAYGEMAAATREAIVAAARAAHAHDFIEAMPQGYDTLIGENGVKLSGGQRQRLAIARALLKNAPILILDEATSALDTESERHVQAALKTLAQGRTTLVVAHRLSTIENANRIVVLDQGRIVAAGTHAELLAQGGAYARLHRMHFASAESR